MVKLEAEKKDGKIIIEQKSFEHLLNCLDNQKYVGELPPCGDGLAMDRADLDSIHAANQAAIDDFNRQCRELLHKQ